MATPLKVFKLAVEEVGTNALAEVDTVAAMANKAIVFFIVNTMLVNLCRGNCTRRIQNIYP